MSNPTTARPASYEIDSNHAFAATLQGFVGMGEGAGSLADASDPFGGYGVPFCLGSLATRREVPPVLTDGYGGLLTGMPPTWIPTGDPLGGPALRFIHGTQSLKYRDCGWTNANTPTTRVIACVFKPRFPPTYGVAKLCVLGGNGGANVMYGLAISVSVAGVLTFGMTRSGGFQSPTTPITLVNDRWYALAIEVTSTGRRYYCYDYTAQALVSADVGNTGSADGTSIAPTSSTDGDLIINHAAVNTSGFEGGIGDFACFLMDGQAWSNTLFANFYTDPWAVGRGSYTHSGTLVTGAATNCGASTEIIMSAVGRPVGGLSQSPTYQWEKSVTPDFASPITITGATSKVLRLPAKRGEIWYTRCKTTDGSAIVTSVGPPITGTASVNPSGEVYRGTEKFLLIGDSISTGIVYIGFARYLVGHKHRVNIAQRALGSTAIYHSTPSLSWQPPTLQGSATLLADALTTATKDGITKALIYLGHNDAALMATTAADFKTYYQNVITYALANGLTWLGLLMPNFRTSSETYNNLQYSYRQKIRELANGTSVVVIDSMSYEYGAQNPGYTADGTHPQGVGSEYITIGQLQGEGYLKYVDPGAIGLSGQTRMSIGL